MEENINVYRMNEYEWWATELSLGAFIGWYDKNIETIDDAEMLSEIEICDIEKGCMYDSEGVTFAEKVQYGRDLINNNTKKYEQLSDPKVGDLVFLHGELMKYVTFKTVLEKGYPNKPFMICGTEA